MSTVRKKKKLATKKIQKGAIGSVFVYGVVILLIVVGYMAVGGLPSINPSQTGMEVSVLSPASSSTKNTLQLQTFGYVTLTPPPPTNLPQSPLSPAPPNTGPAPKPIAVGTNPPPTNVTATVDFRKDLAVPPLNVYSIGDTLSEFGPSSYASIVNPTWRNKLAALGPLAWRLALRYQNGTAVGAAGGLTPPAVNGATYLTDIRAMGGVPVVIVAGDTGDGDINPTTARELVDFFNGNGGQNGGPVTTWIIGNESGGIYFTNLNATAMAMKQADPSITISAPAAGAGTASDPALSQANADAGQYLTYLGYHAYEGGDGKGVYSTPDYLSYAQHVKNTWGKTPSLEEFNWNSGCKGSGPGYTDWESAVYMASIIGNSLSGGARAYMYSDFNGCGTLATPGTNGGIAFGTPLPAYWALGIWTGMNGEFDRFGTQLVDTTVDGIDVTNASGKESGLAQQVELYAMNNGKIVGINKDDGAENLKIGIGGLVTGTYNVWQTNANDPTAPITEVTGNTNFSNSQITISLPAHTVSSIDVQ